MLRPFYFTSAVKQRMRMYAAYASCGIHTTQVQRRTMHEEYQYLSLAKEILDKGHLVKDDRTGIGTRSLFGRSMSFQLQNNTVPLLTTKRLSWTTIVKELLWFLRGSTNANDLSKSGVRIWDKNSSREFLDSRGLYHYTVGDIGPSYGWQWRSFGAQYTDCFTKPVPPGSGVDQIQEIVRQLRHDQTSRRIILCAWNVKQLHEMALPPCHLLAQFNVTSGGELNCAMYQRSADIGLGVPFNIASYSILTHLFAHISGLKAGTFHHFIGDAHIYLNHISAIKLQLQRRPLPFPTIRIVRSTVPNDMSEYKLEDIQLVNYKCHDTILMPMAT